MDDDPTLIPVSLDTAADPFCAGPRIHFAGFARCLTRMARDAGFYDRWWDPTNQTRPRFLQAITWVSDLGGFLGLPTLWWQVPSGHMGLATCPSVGR